MNGEEFGDLSETWGMFLKTTEEYIDNRKGGVFVV